MELVGIYNSISIVGYVLAVVFLLAAVFLFFFLNIPEVIGYLSGYTAKKAIEGMKNGTVKTDLEEDYDSYSNYNMRKNSKANTTSSLNKGQKETVTLNDETMPLENETIPLQDETVSLENETMPLFCETEMLQNETEVLSDETALLTNETTQLDFNETVELSQYVQGNTDETVELSSYNYQNLNELGFVVEEEIAFVHTDERIR